MNRTTISLPEPLHRRVRTLAAERGVSMAELIREAIEEKTTRERPRPKSIGIGASGRDDISRRIGEEGLPREETAAVRRKPKSLGIFSSGYTDTARRASEEGLPGLS